MSTQFGLERKESLPTQRLAYCSILERSPLAYRVLQLKEARYSLWEIYLEIISDPQYMCETSE